MTGNLGLRRNRMKRRVNITLPPGMCHHLGKVKVLLSEMSEMHQEVWIFTACITLKSCQERQARLVAVCFCRVHVWPDHSATVLQEGTKRRPQTWEIR